MGCNNLIRLTINSYRIKVITKVKITIKINFVKTGQERFIIMYPRNTVIV